MVSAEAERRALLLWFNGSRGRRRAFALLRAATARSKAMTSLQVRLAVSFVYERRVPIKDLML